MAFADIHMNNARAEIAAFEALESRLVPGAVIVLDDFGQALYAHQHVEESVWFKARGGPVLEIPTTQGVIVCSARRRRV